MPFREAKLVLLAADLAGWTKAAAQLDALALAELADGYYRNAAARVRAHGGRVVKFIGDAVLATFPEEACVAAVDCALALREDAAALASHSFNVDLGANVHLAVVAAGDFGPDDDRRYDVLGSGVNQLFLMGGGAGVRISEPVYQKLPDERRGAWQKHEASYRFG